MKTPFYTIVLLTICLHTGHTQIIETKLKASDGTGGDEFGESVSMSGTYTIMGASGDSPLGESSGSAYVFLQDGASWVEDAKLIPSDGAAFDDFGWSVGISGDRAIVGAHNDSDDGYASGSAYIFKLGGSTWIEEAKITSSDAAEGDQFGWSVAISGDLAVVGAPFDDDNGPESGSAYIFRRKGSNWIEETKFLPGDVLPGSYFGYSVSIDGDYALIGGPLNNGHSFSSGSAYVFRYDGVNWIQETKLIADDGKYEDFFGGSVAVFGSEAVIGTPYDDEVGSSNSGSAYIFSRTGSIWTQDAKLTAVDASADDYFGSSVSVSGDFAIVGVRGDDDKGSFSGSARIFEYGGGSWSEEAKLLASDGAIDDNYGFSVGILGDVAIVGALQGDGVVPNSGSSYSYSGFTGDDPLAQFDVCYASTGSSEPNNPGALIAIDPITGVGTLVGPTGIIGDNGLSVPVLAIKSTGEIYTLSASNNSDLYAINATTGAGTFVANTGLTSPDSLAFDANDVLYAVANNNLYTVNVTTGVTTLVGPTGFAIKALSYDPTRGAMYGSSTSDQIYIIDVTTGASTLVGTTGLGGSTHALRFDQDGNLFGTKGDASNPYSLISINKTTGQGTIIGPIGFEAVLGLASRVLYTPAPIPCSDITSMGARCVGGSTKTVQVRVNLLNNIIHAGQSVTITIDGIPFTSTIISNGTHSRANVSVPGWSVGDHVVSLVDPAGCLADKHARCGASDDLTKADPYWDDDAEWMVPAQDVPQATTLLGNYPNPFNPSSRIQYALSEDAHVTLQVYNMLGQVVATLVDELQSAGYKSVVWNGRNDAGGTVASGIYICRITAGNFTATKRMLVLK